MKNLTRLASMLLLFFLVIGINNADAQYYGKKKKKKKKSTKTEKVEEKKSKSDTKTDDYFDESGGFAHKLWYGGGFNLNFSGNGAVNIFTLGASPMVGYKITDNFSVGPRVGVQYSNIKFNQGRIYKVEPVSFNLGGFSRYKILDFLFAHFEYEFENEQSIDPDEDGIIQLNMDDEIITERLSRNNLYLGLGYSSGGILSYEIYLLYNFLEPENSFDLPFDLRFGFTYKF